MAALDVVPPIDRELDSPPMAPISLEKVTKIYPNGFKAVEELDLDVSDGEFMVLVGPSGCGKTTALRMVAGLEDISEGTVRISGHVVNEVSPKDRDIAMVFQNYALYPHMTVAENIGFALKLRKVPKAQIKKKVNETAELLGLTEWIDRKPGQLSGGQRQRVAMGRAIVREPSVFLMDEPLSNLDAKLRVQMRAEVSRIQRRVGVATLYVTHDQVEAMTMGDRVAVLSRRDAPAVRQPAGALRQPEEPLRGELHGIAGNEPLRGHDRRGGVLRSHRQPDDRAARDGARLETCAAALRPPVGGGRDPARGLADPPDTIRSRAESDLGGLRRQRRSRGGAWLRAACPLHERRPPGRSGREQG